MEKHKRIYHAIVWKKNSEGDCLPGKRVTTLALNLNEARVILEQIHGKGNVYDLHNKEDAEKPR